MSDFPLTFAECAELVSAKIHPKDVAQDTPYIGLEHIVENGLCLNAVGLASDVDSQKSVFKKGDILFGKLRPYFRKVVIAPFDGICSTDIWVVRPKENTDRNFLFYWMASKQFVDDITRASEGTRMPRAKWEVAAKFKKPECENEKELGFKLRILDEKIAINRQINRTLAAMAQANFKSWFVDFEPVKAKITAIKAGEGVEGITLAAMRTISGKTDEELNQLQAEHPEYYAQLKTTAELFPSAMQNQELGEVPECWNSKTIQDVAKIIKGKSYKSAELAESKTALVTLKSFNRGGGYRLDGLKEYTGSYKAEQEVFAGDLIIAYTDVTQAADVIGKPAMVVSDSRYEHLVISLDVAVVRPEIDDYKYFLYGLAMTAAFQNHTKSYTTGTTVLHLGKSSVSEFQFFTPPEELMKLYGQIVSPMFMLVNEKIEESRNMERLRDTILPKLLSGELSVEAAEFVEDN